MDQLELSIIIVEYKSKKYLFECLKGIKKGLVNIKYEVIIVDNNQEQESKINSQELDAALPSFEYQLVSPSTNKGFGSANNAGVGLAKGRYLLFLNPDTFIIDDSLEKMISFYKRHSEIGALTCLLGPDKNDVQKAFFGKFQSLLGLTLRHYNYQKIDLAKEFFYTDIVTGAVLMIRHDLFIKLGGFDENIFMYLEDDDLCKRLFDLGYKNAVLNTAKIIHLEGRSSNNILKKHYYYQSQTYFWQKHYGFWPTLIMRIIRWPIKLIQAREF